MVHLRFRLIGDHSQRVNIAGCGDSPVHHLLRTGIPNSQSPKDRPCAFDVAIDNGGIKDLGDPEIQKLWHTVRSNQDVAGLNVAVNGQVLVRVCTAAQTCRNNFNRSAIVSW